jgi:glycine cleavage system H protein
MTMKFSKDHEWVKVDGNTATVGISRHAQEQLGDIIFVELPEVGRALKQGDAAAVVESVKAASDVYSAVSGTVTEVNGDLENEPGKVNESAENEGWLFKLTLADISEIDGLMDPEAYNQYLGTLD